MDQPHKLVNEIPILLLCFVLQVRNPSNLVIQLIKQMLFLGSHLMLNFATQPKM